MFRQVQCCNLNSVALYGKRFILATDRRCGPLIDATRNLTEHNKGLFKGRGGDGRSFQFPLTQFLLYSIFMILNHFADLRVAEFVAFEQSDKWF